MDPDAGGSGTFAWRGPFYADLAQYNRVDEDETAVVVSCFEPTENRTASFLPEQGGSSYLDLEVASGAESAHLVGSFCQKDSGEDTGTYRAFARQYMPVSLGGEGWVSGGTFLSPATSTKDVREIVLAPAASGELAALLVEDFTADLFTVQHYSPELGWVQTVSSFESELGAVVSMGPLPAPLLTPSKPFNRYPSDAFWSGAWDDVTGNFFSFFTDVGGGDDSYIARSTDQLQNFTKAGTETTTESVLRSQMLSDGLGTTLLWTEVESTDSEGVLTAFKSRASWEGASDFDTSPSYERTISEVPSYLSAELILDDPEERFIPDFAAASDGAGTVISVFYQWDPGYLGSCASLAPYCQYRLYASVRSPSGEWIGPTPLDEHLQVHRASTTYYQDAEDQGGIAQARPQIVYAGGGRFWVASVYTDASDTSAPYAQIFLRGYTVGEGWDQTEEIVSLGNPFYLKTNGTAFSAYRPINDVYLAADASGAGYLALVAQHLDDDLEHGDASLREYRHSVFRYDPASGGWQDPETVPVDLGCPARVSGSLTYCSRAKFSALVFEGGETVALVPIQVTSSGIGMVLGSYEYRPKTEAELEEEETE
jgi:hypothetical protein